MITIRNLEKYISDHPELELHRETILTGAREGGRDYWVPAGLADQLIGRAAIENFWNEILQDPEHLRMGTSQISSEELFRRQARTD